MSQNVFSLINDISFDKKGLIHESDEMVKLYNIYLVELMLSQYADCILYVNELNCRRNIPKKSHFDYLFYSISKRKRFSKLMKPSIDEETKLIMDVYGYSVQRAEEVKDFFNSEDFDEMKKLLDKGGMNK